MNISPREHHLWSKVAKLYYEDDFTQGEIAQKLGFSRVKIHRILRAAREAGIIQVHITTPDASHVELERELMRDFGLRDCLVVGGGEPGEELYLSLAEGAVSWLKGQLQSGIRVGLGLGRTISYLPRVFQSDQDIPCIFTEVAGAVSDHSWGFGSSNPALQMADICGGKAELFYAPTLVSNADLKRELTKEPSIRKALERARKSDLVLQSVGPVDETALLYIHGYLSQHDLAQLQSAGAVGDALGCFYDSQGRILPSPVDDRMIGLHLSELVDIPWSVMIAGGEEKVVPIQAALTGGYFNVLITDLKTAQTLTGKD